MLSAWAAVTDADATLKRKHVESNEAREGRLRERYEQALQERVDGDAATAREALQAVVDELDELPELRATKRHRTGAADPDGPPPWVAALKHAALRNLGDVHAEEGEHLAAMHAYARALDEDDRAFIVWCRAARAAAEAGWLHVSRRAYERARALRPRNIICEEGYRAVLTAIGDDDADLLPDELSHKTLSAVRKMLCCRSEGAAEERGEQEEIIKLDGKVWVTEGRWCPLIEALAGVLANRLGTGKSPSAAPVGASVQVLIDGHVKAGVDTMIHEEVNCTSHKDANAAQSKEPQSSPQTPNEVSPSQGDADASKELGDKQAPAAAGAADKAPPDPRRSLRNRGETPAGTDVVGVDSAFLDDMNSLMLMAQDINFALSDGESDRADKALVTPPKSPHNSTPDDARICSWTTPATESEELKEVIAFCVELNASNSGPFDALQRVLLYLAEKESNQYLSEIAQAWLALRKYGIVDVPGNTRVSLCVADALLVSGSKVRKTMAKKYKEAERILAIVALLLGEVSSTEDAEISRFLSMQLRCEWLCIYIAEKNNNLSEAFVHAQQGLESAKELLRNDTLRLAEEAGPEFAGRFTEVVVVQFDRYVRRLKASSELQKATKEISDAKAGDRARAAKAASLLAPSIFEVIKTFRMNMWRSEEAESSAEEETGLHASDSLDEREDLEKRLNVFAEACKKAKDTVGEVVAASVRLRLNLAKYWLRYVRERAGNKKRGANDNGESSSAILSSMGQDIRHYANSIRTMTNELHDSLSSPTIQAHTDLTMELILEIATTTVVALCEALARVIPLVDRVPASNTMSTIQKNQRLAFTRCLLAFCRCIETRVKMTTVPPSSSVPPKWMLPLVAFCLSVLAARGCCREEGTSGALIRVYMNNLTARLQEVVRSGLLPSPRSMQKRLNSREGSNHSVEPKLQWSVLSLTYTWDEVHILRQQLAQCFKCLYGITDLESPQAPSEDVVALQWLYRGCVSSRAQGLKFISGEVQPSVPKMTAEICRAVYLLYRRRLMEQHRTDGAKAKCREIIQEIVKHLQECKPSAEVAVLDFDSFNSVVTAAVEETGEMKEACERSVDKLKAEWIAAKKVASRAARSGMKAAEVFQFAVLYFECYMLNALGALITYEGEFKRNKNIKSRKRAGEFVQKLTDASCDCVTALRYRPWSAGAWIALGRIFVELADVLLDERELFLRTFGIFQNENGDPNESAEGVVLKAEVCFEFAQNLVDGVWADTEGVCRVDISASEVYGDANEALDDVMWCGFGDDGDLFGMFGLTNETSSRPCLADELHPRKSAWGRKEKLKAAIAFGRASLYAIRAREDRHWYNHWGISVLEGVRVGKRKRELPSHVKESLEVEQAFLTEGMDIVKQIGTPQIDIDEPEWRRDGNVFGKQMWYYMLRKAKLSRKLGASPDEFLPMFKAALNENKRVREEAGEPCDIELRYQFHAARAKALLEAGETPELSLLRLVRSFSEKDGQSKIADDADVKDTRKMIGMELLEALDDCKNGTQFSEYFFKATYYRAAIFRMVLRQPANATNTLAAFFKADNAAAKGNGVHRGYFYEIWNYRHTDPGYETAVETDRKLVRWRHKMLSLYGSLLREKGHRNLIAGIVSRFRRRLEVDLPVSGALLDDFILAYAQLTRNEIIRCKSDPPIFETSDQSFRRTWDVFCETLRLMSAAKIVLSNVHNKLPAGVEPGRFIASGRPWCLLPIANALHLEKLRWEAAHNKTTFDVAAAKALPYRGKVDGCPREALARYAETMTDCGDNWKLDSKLDKLLRKRVEQYGGKPRSETNGEKVVVTPVRDK